MLTIYNVVGIMCITPNNLHIFSSLFVNMQFLFKLLSTKNTFVTEF